MPELAVTVSQTADLVSQGIVVSWTGGAKKKSVRPQNPIQGENFLQIAQCWGDDPMNPGHPDRTTCQFGAFPNIGRDSNVEDNTTEHPNNIAIQDAQFTAKGTSSFNPTYTSIPFRSVDGRVVKSVEASPTGALIHNTSVEMGNNQFFTKYTSNEVTWAGQDSSGSGSVKFEIQTAMQSPHLGCGQPVMLTGKPITGQSCWLVVIPRGTADSGQTNITRPALFWDAWQHNIAVKLDFKPVGVRCDIGSTETQLTGSELIAGAIASWQPNLCSGTAGSAFVLSTGSESDALVKASTTGSSPLAFTSRPLITTTADPLEYAPVGIGGLAVSFAVDRRVQPVPGMSQDFIDRETQPFTSMKLTPRLIAKLLTASYIASLPPGADLSHVGYLGFRDQGHNAKNLTKDPDFLAINDAEWAAQDLNSISLSDMLMPAGRSDLAVQLWRYVISDPDAVAWLNGTPDPWGMIVNPWFSTNSDVNKTGTGLVLPRDNFPKADPVTYVDPLSLQVPKSSNAVGDLNLVTWRPYTSNFDQGAYLTLRGDGKLLGGWDSTLTPPAYGKTARSLVGEQGVMGVTTTASAVRYQNVTASLRNSAGEFVSPTTASMLAAAAAMTPTPTQAQVLEFDPSSAQAHAAPSAYPLTMPIYAAANPTIVDTGLRAKYAALIRYAASSGQVSGTALGQLPDGYASIPASWALQALAAAAAIENLPVSASAPVAVAAQGATPAVIPAPAIAGGAVAATAPAAMGSAAGPLLGQATPADPVGGPAAAAVPTGILAGLAAAGGFPLFLRFRRKS
jgi:hypothetical protein